MHQFKQTFENDYYNEELHVVNFENEALDGQEVFESFKTDLNHHLANIWEKARLSDRKFQKSATKLELLLTGLYHFHADANLIKQVEELPKVVADFGNVARHAKQAFVASRLISIATSQLLTPNSMVQTWWVGGFSLVFIIPKMMQILLSKFRS